MKTYFYKISKLSLSKYLWKIVNLQRYQYIDNTSHSSYAQRNHIKNQTEIRLSLYLPFYDWFGTKRTSVWFQIIRKMVNTIWIWFEIIVTTDREINSVYSNKIWNLNFFDLFGTKQNSIRCHGINWGSIITIIIWFDLTR